MSPTRRLTDHRGYLTEPCFDGQGFAEAPLPHLHPERLPAPSTTVTRTLDATRTRMQAAHASHLGYPYNLVGAAASPSTLDGYLINNLGDPYVGSHYGSEVCALEREAVAWMMDLWECDAPGDFWGSIGASGTEGNLWALYLARETLPRARLLYGREAHYSIPKAARILAIEAQAVDCTPDGAIDLEALAAALALDDGRPLILALTCGTTVKGAHDDIGGALGVLEAAGVGAGRRFVHVDGALNAMVLPFVDGVAPGLRPSFRHAIDSLSASGHKMIGTPMPCGVLVARRRHVERVASAIAYLRSDDTTLMGSRNGHAVVAIWSRLMGHGAAGFRADVNASLARTERMVAALRRCGVPVQRNAHGFAVVFPEPCEAIVARYQLACSGGAAHAIVMPSVTDALIERFLRDYVAWWNPTPDAFATAMPPAMLALGGSVAPKPKEAWFNAMLA